MARKYMHLREQSMFTLEQMSGSGQISIVDQINEYDRRRKELRQSPHVYHSDAGHAWLQVRYEDLKIFGIFGKITSYSYRDGDTVYLEEDQDAITYLKVLFPEGWTSPEFEAFKNLLSETDTDEYSDIRNLARYEAAT